MNISPLSQILLNARNISISSNDERTVLKIVYNPSWFGWALIVALLLFVVFASTIISDKPTAGLFALFAFLIAVTVSLEIKMHLAIFDANTGKVLIKSHSIVHSNINLVEREFPLNNVSQAGIRRHIWRYADSFQVFLSLKGDTIDISGRFLNFQNAQLCAETIRDFLQLKTPIKAEG